MRKVLYEKSGIVDFLPMTVRGHTTRCTHTPEDVRGVSYMNLNNFLPL